MSPSLICLLLLIGTTAAAPAADPLSQLFGAARGIGYAAGDMLKGVPVVGGFAAPFVDGTKSFVDSASRSIGK